MPRGNPCPEATGAPRQPALDGTPRGLWHTLAQSTARRGASGTHRPRGGLPFSFGACGRRFIQSRRARGRLSLSPLGRGARTRTNKASYLEVHVSERATSHFDAQGPLLISTTRGIVSFQADPETHFLARAAGNSDGGSARYRAAPVMATVKASRGDG